MMLNKVVLITGSSSGIGRATALSLARLGASLVLHGTNVERLEETALTCQELSPNKLKPIYYQGDVRDVDKTANALIDATLGAYKQLDVLVNNAGLFKPFGTDAPQAYENFLDLMNINVNFVVKLSILATPHLRATKGNIVNVSSNLHAQCFPGGFAYCTAKAALTMFTKSLAVDLAPDVRVNSVSPGPVATLMSTRNGMDVDKYRELVGGACLTNRVGEPEEISRVITFLASPESSFITGSDYIIDGECCRSPLSSQPPLVSACRAAHVWASSKRRTTRHKCQIFDEPNHGFHRSAGCLQVARMQSCYFLLLLAWILLLTLLRLVFRAGRADSDDNDTQHDLIDVDDFSKPANEEEVPFQTLVGNGVAGGRRSGTSLSRRVSIQTITSLRSVTLASVFGSENSSINEQHYYHQHQGTHYAKPPFSIKNDPMKIIMESRVFILRLAASKLPSDPEYLPRFTHGFASG